MSVKSILSLGIIAGVVLYDAYVVCSVVKETKRFERELKKHEQRHNLKKMKMDKKNCYETCFVDEEGLVRA